MGGGVVVEESMGAISCELLQSNYSIYYTKRSIVWVITILSVSVLIGQQVEAAMIVLNAWKWCESVFTFIGNWMQGFPDLSNRVLGS